MEGNFYKIQIKLFENPLQCCEVISLQLIKINEKNFLKIKLFVLYAAAAVAAKSLQSCPTLCNPIDSSPPGSTIPGFLQARTLEWVAISFSITIA